MTTRIFGTGFLGRNPFDQENRNNFKERWFKMTNNEKLEFINRRMESFEDQEDIFSIQSMDSRCKEWLEMTVEEKQASINEKKKIFKERWSKMTDNEKLEFINRRMESFDDHEDPFSIQSIDSRCKEWLEMTVEEKQASINEKKKIFKERWSKMTDNEKLEFMNKKMGTFDNGRNPFSIESMDSRCKEWLKMTVEEKEAIINGRGKFFQNNRGQKERFF